MRESARTLISCLAGAIVLGLTLACQSQPKTSKGLQPLGPSPTLQASPTLTATAPEIASSFVGASEKTRTPTSLLRAQANLPLVSNVQSTPITSASPTLTFVPSPTPTPTLPWPEPLEKPGRSKLGLHVQWNNSPEIMEFIRRMKPAVVKSVGDLGFLAEVKAVSPSTVTVARLLNSSLSMEGDPVAAARSFVAQNLPEYRRHPAVDYWEGLNEPGIQGRMEWYTAFEMERVRLMAEHGLRCAVGAFSTGVPEWEEFAAFLPAIAVARDYQGILTLHEYDAPTLDRSVGASLPGHPAYANRGAFALRYRWWYEDFLKPKGLVLPLVISEAGIDGTIPNRPGPQGRGWQDFRSYWVEQGLADEGIKALLRQLSWYDAQLRQDPYVIGFAVFTAGAMTREWASYDITSVLRHIATYIVVPAAR